MASCRSLSSCLLRRAASSRATVFAFSVRRGYPPPFGACFHHIYDGCRRYPYYKVRVVSLHSRVKQKSYPT